MKRHRVVIVNNEKNIAQCIAMALRERDIDVDIYAHGKDALEPLRTNPPDLVLLDQSNRPKGTELFALLDEADTAAPVIFVSPHAEDVRRELGRRGTPAADYIESPFSLREVVQRVTNLLD